MFSTCSEMFQKARCLVVNFLLLVNMHIACLLFLTRMIFKVFLEATTSQTKHSPFPEILSLSTLQMKLSSAHLLDLLHTFRDTRSSTQPISAFDYQSNISVSSITQTLHLLVLPRQKRKQYDGISIHHRLMDKTDGPRPAGPHAEKTRPVLKHNQQEEICNRTSSFLHGQ